MKRRISTLAFAVLFAATSITASYAGQVEKYLDDPTGISPVKTQDWFEARTWAADSNEPVGIYPAGFDPTGISPVKTQDWFEARTWAADSDEPVGIYPADFDPTGISPVKMSGY